MIDLTTGEPAPRGSLEIRAREAEAARVALGVPVRVNLALPNRELMDCPANRYAIATELRRYRPQVVIGVVGRTPSASPDHFQGQLLIEAARFYSQLTKWDDRFGGLPPYRVPHLVYAAPVRRRAAAMARQLYRRHLGHVREKWRPSGATSRSSTPNGSNG